MAVEKKIRNTTGSQISIVQTGVTIPAGQTHVIDPINYLYWATPETIAEITSNVNAGSLVVNDGSNDLSAAQALLFLQYADWLKVLDSGTTTKRTINEINFIGASVTTTGDNRVNVDYASTSDGKLLNFFYFGTGITSDKWLNVHHPSNNSESSPYVTAWAGSIVGLSYSNANDSSETDMKIYKNGTLQYTWAIRDKRTAWNVNNSGFLSVAQGDRLSMFMSGVDGTQPKDPLGEIIVRVNAMGTGSGGTTSGV